MSAERTASPTRPAPWAFAAPWGASGYGHTPQLEAPDTVVGTMRDWLDRHFAPAIV